MSLRQQGAKFRRLVDQVRHLWASDRPATAFTAPVAEPMARPGEPQTGGFGPNPGALTLQSYMPHHLPTGAPLVVLLHGCGQNPEDFATESGWRALAMQHHFALLMPGQTDDNNRQRCFNWFRAEDMTRGTGESGSIMAMVEAMLKSTHADRKRVFVTGLSAGGAMTANLLASCPDIFAGGAVVAGLPAGAARNMVGAMTRMSGRGTDHSGAELAQAARSVAPVGYTGPWPRLSIWHGQDDNVVAPSNGADVATQFATLGGITSSVTKPIGRDGSQHTIWGDAVELRSIAGGQHVYPADAAAEIARFWGIIP
jgi:feruloyl esterase